MEGSQASLLCYDRTMENQDKHTVSVNVVDEMKEAYGAYSMAVLIGRAIPDLYDGLKPVTRRVLTAMTWLGLKPSARYMKSARVEGEVMGKLHAHGGAYGAMVTVSQPWTMNHPYVDGWGNFGSPTDGPAAPRYTEAKLTEFAYSVMLGEVDTWNTKPNYDGTLQEPTQLNVKVPTVLLNGGEGIGVGFATKIAPHNLRAVVKAMALLAEGKQAQARTVLVPDFATGCDVVEDEGLDAYLTTGKGSIRMRAQCEHFEADHGKKSKRAGMTFTSLPMHANTEQVGDQIRDAVAAGKITTVADVRDETDREGVRFIVIGKANVSPALMEAEVYRYTSLDTKYSANNLVIDGAKPVELAPTEMITRWMEWRDGRLLVALKTELETHRDRQEIVKGFIQAHGIIHEVIDAVTEASSREDARKKLVALLFTRTQADAILDMRISQLTKLDTTKLKAELKELQTRIKELIKLNSSKKLRSDHVLAEAEAIAVRHGNARRSKVVKLKAGPKLAEPTKAQKVETGAKPRFIQIDEKLGVVTQLKKLQREAMVIERTEKMLFICDNGKFYKLPSSFKGPIAGEPVKVLAKAKTDSIGESAVIVVFKHEGDVRANVFKWESLTKCTAKGKSYLPEGAELLHIGGTYELERAGRRKNVTVGINTVQAKTVGGRGTKLDKVENCVLG